MCVVINYLFFSGVNKYTENLSFIVSDMPASFHHSSPDVLECLTLSYTVLWPLNIIFSQEAMERYAKIFQFLLKMRRISWALECDSEVNYYLFLLSNILLTKIIHVHSR